MKIGKVFKVFKKGSKVAKSRQGGGPVSDFEWPSGIRIGVFGHANSGKSVYFTVLNEECKVSKNLGISVTDNATAGEFLANYRAIWGIGATSEVGTVVDLKGEKKFPEPTHGDRVLQFTAIVDRTKKYNVVSYDYNGKAISISEQHELRDKVADFISGCHGILFFFDPKALSSDVRCQAHVASFVNMLEQLAPLTRRRLPIPIGLVITKADVLDGFKAEDQVVLVPPENENLLAEDYELFLEKVLGINRIESDSTWAGTVRNILVKTKEFLKVVVGRTLDFQVFFTSSTGQPPEKVGTDVGRSIYAPPKRMSPIGVREPLYWVLNRINRSRKVSKFRSLAKFVAYLSIIWMVAYSLPPLYHFAFQLNRTTSLEDNILAAYDGNVTNTSSQERSKIKTAYDHYQRSWIVNWLYPKFQVPARQLYQYYTSFNEGEAIAALEQTITQMAGVVADPDAWPVYREVNDSLILDDLHMLTESDLEGYHKGDEHSPLYKRSGRALEYWTMFKQTISAGDTATVVWQELKKQIEKDKTIFGKDLSKSEIALGGALIAAAEGREQKGEERAQVVEAASEFDQLKSEIESRTSAKYLLETAVTKLERLRGKLAGDPNRADEVSQIDRYLNAVKYFDEYRSFRYEITNLPADHHLHIKVMKSGTSGDWKTDQFRTGKEYKITWRKGDHIYVALDDKNHAGQGGNETWGASPKSLEKLDSWDYVIFDMDGDITFTTGETITIDVKEDLKSKLPRF